MALKYNTDQRREYLNMTDRIGANWVTVFDGNTDFYSAAYWDLLTNIWRNDDPVRKTDALRFMTGIKSPHTAGKYIETAIQEGILVETDNPHDARSKLLSLSVAMRAKLDVFFDTALDEIHAAANSVGRLDTA